MAQERRGRQARNRGDTNAVRLWVEALAAGIGAILAATTIGFIVWRGIGEAGAPPVLHAEVSAIREERGAYVAEIVVTNTGETAAAEVVVEGSLPADVEEGEPETSQFTLDYVPSHSHRKGGLIFSRDPRVGGFVLRPLGYAVP